MSELGGCAEGTQGAAGLQGLPPTPRGPTRSQTHTSTWASSQASRRTDFTLLTWGMFRWIPEQLRQMNTPRV